MTLITEKYLKSIGASEAGIKFLTECGLERFPLSLLKDVKGDCWGFKQWLLSEKPTLEHNDDGLITKKIYQNGRFHVYEYNDKGLLIKDIDIDGYVILYEYNDKGLMTKETSPSGDDYIHEYNNVGLLISIHFNNDYKFALEYNDANLLTEVTISNGDVYSKEYSDDGLLTKEIYPDLVFLYEYYDTGNLKRVLENNKEIIWLPNFRDCEAKA